MNGQIIRIISDKGFGFIRSGKTEYFFHRSSVIEPVFDDLYVGQDVEFDSGDSCKGPRAENVRGN